MGGLNEQRFGGSGWGVERTRVMDVGVETGGGDDSETGLVMEEYGKQQSMIEFDANLTRTTEIKRRSAMTIYNYVCMQACMQARRHRHMEQLGNVPVCST